MRAARARGRRGRLGLLLPTLALALSSCGRDPELIVALDEAFVALRPGLAEALARQKAPGLRLSYLELPLAGGASELAGMLASREAPPLAVAASPLLARALLEGADRNQGGPGSDLLRGAPLLGIEWPLEPRPGLLALVGDPLPAYRAAGKALGSQVAAYRGAGEEAAVGALLFSEGPGRPPEAAEAFRTAFEEAAGFPPLVRLLGAAAPFASPPATPSADAADLPAAPAVPLAGAGAPAAPPTGAGEGPSSPDLNAAAESAVRDLLGSELRLLLIAVGEAGPGAARAAEGPGRAIGLASPQASAYGRAAFLLAPDEKAAARLVVSTALSAGTSTAWSAGRRPLPYRLLALPAARSFEAGGKSLARRLEEAAEGP